MLERLPSVCPLKVSNRDSLSHVSFSISSHESVSRCYVPLPLSNTTILVPRTSNLVRLMHMEQTVDVSRFMLFEATGDSEADCDLIARVHHDDDDDDAQSCSYDGSETHNFNMDEQFLGLGYKGSCDPDFKNDADKKKDGGEEEEACVYYGTSYCDEGDDEIQKHPNSSLSVDSGQHLMDEMEKNRRFWEACLAS